MRSKTHKPAFKPFVRNCLHCKAEFTIVTTRGDRKLYCDRRCGARAGRSRRKPSRGRVRTYVCDYCHCAFYTRNKRRKSTTFCNRACAQRYIGERRKSAKVIEVKPFVIDPLEHLGLVCKIAREHQTKHDATQPVKDLDQYSDGIMGLLHACQRFDPSLNNRFSSYASQCIRGYIRKAYRDRNRFSVDAVNVEFPELISDVDVLPNDHGQFANPDLSEEGALTCQTGSG